jgi:uncharacterized protein YecE (DUF72 family)
MAGSIRAGMGGWQFKPWRGVFFPEGLRQADELDYATHHVTAIEINGTYHSLQKPASFAKWAAVAPEGFVFSVKASRYCTNRRTLANMDEPLGRFLNQGLVELGPKLGPILWQFMPFKRFEPEDFGAFLKKLPRELGGLPLRHVMDVRHDSFVTPEFVQLCRDQGVAICLSEADDYPMFPDVTSDVIYARLMKGRDEIETGYPRPDITAWAARFKTYAEGGAPGDLPLVDPSATVAKAPRDVFAFFIREGKVRAPVAAQALIAEL